MRRGTSVAAASGRNVRPARRHTAAGWKWTQEVSVAKEDRGFASMDRAKQREIASKGGKAAHQKGTAHEWTSEEAGEARGRGGRASHRRRKESDGQGSENEASSTERSANDRGE